MAVRSQLLFERLDPGGSRIESDMMLKGGEMHQVAVEVEGRDSISNHLYRTGCILVNDVPKILQDLPDLWREVLDILVDIPDFVCVRGNSLLKGRYNSSAEPWFLFFRECSNSSPEPGVYLRMVFREVFPIRNATFRSAGHFIDHSLSPDPDPPAALVAELRAFPVGVPDPV